VTLKEGEEKEKGRKKFFSRNITGQEIKIVYGGNNSFLMPICQVFAYKGNLMTNNKIQFRGIINNIGGQFHCLFMEIALRKACGNLNLYLRKMDTSKAQMKFLSCHWRERFERCCRNYLRLFSIKFPHSRMTFLSHGK
jgi:hypothetical protein